MKKKKVLFWSNYPGAPTGFGGFMKDLLSYLYKLNKYDLYMYASGVTYESPEFAKWPWKTFGTLPNNPMEANEIMKDPGQARMVNYGSYFLNKIIQEVKPQILFAIEDFWAFEPMFSRPWFDKINCAIAWTCDSLPVLPTALENAHKIKYHYVWADFARKEFHRLGFTNVKTLRGCVDTNSYKRLSDEKRRQLRVKHNIPLDAFCVGNLNRNQLRKLFPNLIEGYKLFKDQNPQVKHPRLLIFTHWSEPGGWDLPRLMKEFSLDPNEVLCCYKCRKTNDYFVMPFKGQDIDNPITKDQKSLITVNITDKLTTEQVNEWYNLLDVSCGPITSGGQERFLQESKLNELITLINPYSCGEDNCVPEAYSLPLDFATYREHHTQFIKASVYPSSIAKQLKKVYEMPEDKKREWGRKAREWVLNNFSIEVIGKQYEQIIDSMPEINYDFNFTAPPKNPTADISDVINSDNDDLFVKEAYKRILDMNVDNNDSGYQYWMQFINS